MGTQKNRLAVPMRRFFWAPKTHVWTGITLKTFVRVEARNLAAFRFHVQMSTERYITCQWISSVFFFWMHVGHARIQRGSNFDNVFYLFFVCFFLVWGEEGFKYHYKRAIKGQPAKRHLNGVSLAGRWWPNIECWLCSFVILRGSGPVLLRNPIFFVIFQGGPDPLPPPPPLDPRMLVVFVTRIALDVPF